MKDHAEDVRFDHRSRAEYLESLLLRSGIDSALVGVPKLARVLGMGASTIYSYMRAEKFFMPYRMVNGTPMVKIDDLVEWYLSADSEVGAAKVPPSQKLDGDSVPDEVDAKGTQFTRGRKSTKTGSLATVEYRPLDVASQEAADKAVDGLVAGVMRRIQRQQRSMQP